MHRASLKITAYVSEIEEHVAELEFALIRIVMFSGCV